MAYSGGVFSRIYNFVTDAANNINPQATRFDGEFDGIATGLSTCLLKDGTQTVTANIPMATFKFTGLGAGTAATDSARLDQLQTVAVQGGGDTGGSSTVYTLTLSPAITAYAAGLVVRARVHTANGAAPTLNINGVGAKNIQLNGTNVSANMMPTGAVQTFAYNATSDKFDLQSHHNLGALLALTTYTSGASTHTTHLAAKSMRVICVGGGGGGGGAADTSGGANAAAGCGGSAGSYAEKFIAGPAASYATSVGAGGTGGSAGSNGSAGADTTFGSTVVVAKGGGRGFAMASGTSVASALADPGGLASASTGDIKVDGRTASSAWRISGTAAYATSGAESFFGDGGQGGGLSLAAAGRGGATAQGYGSGGGGSVTQNNNGINGGGTGAGGIIIVYEYS